MPRFFFDMRLRGEEDVRHDIQGHDLVGIESAQSLAADMWMSLWKTVGVDPSKWEIEVVDPTGNVLMTVPTLG